MKSKDIKVILENTISNEIRKAILAESKDYYHVMADNQPIETFETYEDAQKYIDDVKDKHSGKNLLIDKKKYGSYDDMIDSLDEMSDEINNDKNINEMKRKLKEDISKFEEDYYNTPTDGEMSENDMYEDDIYEDDMYEDDMYEDDMYEDDMYEDDMTELSPHEKYMDSASEMDELSEMGLEDEEEHMGTSPNERMGIEKIINKYLRDDDDVDTELDEDGMCMECGDKSMEEGDYMDDELSEYGEYGEEKGMCSECGSMLNEEGICSECSTRGGMNEYDIDEEYLWESKKKKIRLKESELVYLIKKMVNESIPGLNAANKSKEGSKKDSSKHYSEVDAKMKKHLKFEGNDNPEFPKQVGTGEKVARKNTPTQEDEIGRNFAGLQNLEYDVEPSEKFKERLKMAIEGHSKMGNGTETPKPSIKPSNKAPKGKEAKEKSGNQVKTDTSKKIEKQVKNRKKDTENKVIYKKEKVPVDTSKKSDKSLNETKLPSNVIQEIEKMKKLSSYNKRTQ